MTGRTLFAKAAAVAFGAVLTATTVAPAFADDPFSRITLTLTPVYTTATNQDIPPSNTPQTETGGPPNTDAVFLDYGVNIQLTKALALYWQHDNADFTIDSPIIGGFGKIPIGADFDRFDTEGLKYNVIPGLAVSAGYRNRTRMCCPDDSQTTTYKGYHGPFAGVNYAFGPLSSIGPIFDFDLMAQYVDHPYNPALAAGWDTPYYNVATGALQYTPSATTVSNPRYQPYGGSGFIYPASISVHIPINHSHTLIPFFTFARLADYFASDPGPEYYNTTVFGLVKVFAPWLVFHAAVVNLKEETTLNYPLGNINPFGTNDWVRLTTLSVGFDFHFRG